MDIQVITEQGRVPVTVLKVDGNIDTNTYQQFQSKAEGVIEEGARYILVDLTKTPFMSSAGLRALHYIFNKLREKDTESPMSEEDVRRGISAGTYKSPHLKLLNLSKETRAAFDLSGFDMFIETFNDRRTAIDSFQAAG